MKDYKEIIGQNIRKYRKEKGMTQKDLAEAIGVKNTTVSMWEVGSNTMPIEVLAEICRVLGVSLADMARDEKEKAPAGDADARAIEFINLFSSLSDQQKDLTLAFLKALLQSGS